MTKIISVALTVIFGVLLVSIAVDATTSLSGTTITLENSETISNGTNGTITLTADVMKLVGTASTSAITVGDEPAAPTINGMVFGYCSFGNTTVTASSTAYFNCTAIPAGALVENDRVFVQATGTLDTGFVFEAASTTGVSTIQIRVRNVSGELAAPDTTMGAASINFWAVR